MKGSDIDCVDALKPKKGGVLVEINFERVKLDSDLAEKIKSKNLYRPNPVAKGADSEEKNNFVIYRHISCKGSLENSECIKDKCGWKRLFLFENMDVNNVGVLSQIKFSHTNSSNFYFPISTYSITSFNWDS